MTCSPQPANLTAGFINLQPYSYALLFFLDNCILLYKPSIINFDDYCRMQARSLGLCCYCKRAFHSFLSHLWPEVYCLKSSQYEYESRGARIIYPQPREYESVVSWFFSVHYLSLCGGYGYSDGETVEPRLLECEPKEAGWIFKGNDPFIVNFQSVYSDGQDDIPVIVPIDLPPELHTRAPFAMLVSGIAISLFATLFAIKEGVGFKHHILVRGYHGSLCLIAVCFRCSVREHG